MYKIDITMTACVRPKIMAKTIDSFFENMFAAYKEQGHKLNLILNIDPAGKQNCDINDFKPILRDRFDRLKINIPHAPSFPKAFKWVWTNISDDSNYIFNLEDDWELMKKVDILKLIKILENEKRLVLLRFAAFYAGPETMKNWNKFFPYNGRYYECPEELIGGLGFCGHPSIIKSEFVKNIARHLDEDRNPEKQFHRGNRDIVREVLSRRYGVFSFPGDTAPGTPPLIRDIGRQWMVDNAFRKQGSKAFFTQWERGT